MSELTLEMRTAAESDEVEAVNALIEAGQIRTRRTMRAIPRSTPRPTGAQLNSSSTVGNQNLL